MSGNTSKPNSGNTDIDSCIKYLRPATRYTTILFDSESVSPVQLFVIVANQAPLSMELSKQEY